MSDLKKHSLALSFIAALLFLRFLLIPLIQWQNDQIVTIAMLERKIEKVDVFLQSEDLFNEQYLALSNALTNLEYHIFLYQDESTFQLKQQKIVESNLLKSTLKISSIGWQNTIASNDLPLLLFSLEFRVSGKTNKIIEYLTQLQSQEKTPDIQAINLSFRNQNQGSLGSISARVRITYYMFNNDYVPYANKVNNMSFNKHKKQEDLK